jgi:hypothetical protein
LIASYPNKYVKIHGSIFQRATYKKTSREIPKLQEFREVFCLVQGKLIVQFSINHNNKSSTNLPVSETRKAAKNDSPVLKLLHPLVKNFIF